MKIILIFFALIGLVSGHFGHTLPGGTPQMAAPAPMNHGGHGHGQESHEILPINTQGIHLLRPCTYTASDNTSNFDLSPLMSLRLYSSKVFVNQNQATNILLYREYTQDHAFHFIPFDRMILVNFCRDTVWKCSRGNVRQVESHSVCMPRDVGEFSAGQSGRGQMVISDSVNFKSHFFLSRHKKKKMIFLFIFIHILYYYIYIHTIL
jgi:hypothetical protein